MIAEELGSGDLLAAPRHSRETTSCRYDVRVKPRPAATGPASLSPVLLAAVPPRPDARAVNELGGRVTDWERLVATAAHHGIAGLVWRALREAGAPVPRPAARLFQASVAHGRAANEIRFQALGEILGAFESEGIRALVLKGPALVGLFYGDPALRPMSDLDLLVARSDAMRAQRLLGGLGFTDTEPVTSSALDHAHHLPGAVRQTDGVNVLVEVHHNVFNWVTPSSLDFDGAWPDCRVVEGAGQRFRVLGLEHTLSHLCWSLGEWWRPFRLLTVADIVRLAILYRDSIEWSRLEHGFPAVLNTLAIIDRLVPLDELREETAFCRATAHRRRCRLSFEGWPPEPLRREGGRKGSVPTLIRDTLFPPEWWIRLSDGLGLRPSAPAVRIGHGWRLASRVARRVWHLRRHRRQPPAE